MSKEICCEAATGQTIYALIRRETDGEYWKSTLFEAYSTAHLPSYAIALTEAGSSGVYSADFPIAITAAGEYSASFRNQVGGSPAESDAKGLPQTIAWGGTAIAIPVVPDASGNVAVRKFSDGVDVYSVTVDADGNLKVAVAGYQPGMDPATQTAAGFAAVIAALSAVPASCSAAVLAAVIEGSFTLQKAIMLIMAACAGPFSGAVELGADETGTIIIKSPDGSTTRITAVTDELGNRLSVTYNLP